VSENELRYPSWQTPLHEAIIELDPQKFAKKVEEVEALMLERLQEISSQADHHEERQAIADATSVLRVLKKGRLSHTDLRGKESV
jgi:hypothetical protein